jgi:hypothetical protein
MEEIMRQAGIRARQRGWGAAEYLAVLAGLMIAWRGARAALSLFAEYHDEFSWALMVPF